MAGKHGRRGWGWLRKLPSGRWHASYIGPDLARHNAPTTYGSRMDGEAWLASERRLIERDEWTSPAVRAAAKTARGVTVTEYAEHWIIQRVNLTRSVRADYERKVRKFVAPTPLGRLPLSAVTPEACRSWYANLDASKPSARASAYAFLRTVLNTATSEGMFERNPAVISGASAQPRTKRQQEVLTTGEVARLAEAAPERLRAYVLVSVYLALRKGEALELRRRDVSDDVSTITITRSHLHHPGGDCEVKDTKTGDTRVLSIPPHIRADVKHHLALYAAADADGLLFPSPLGRCHLSDDAVRKALKPVLTAIGHPGMVLHDFRHTGATLTAQTGATLAETMQRLGHRSTAAAMRYQHAASDRDALLAERLSAMANTG